MQIKQKKMMKQEKTTLKVTAIPALIALQALSLEHDRMNKTRPKHSPLR